MDTDTLKLEFPYGPTSDRAFELIGIEPLSVLTNSSVRKILKLFRANDDSNLWPINGEFCCVTKAARHLRDDGFYCDTALEYSLAIEAECSRIVNSI